MADYEAEILVNGKPIKMFQHKGELFVEGRKGSKFELRIKNNTWGRIEVVPSVDGLSVLDGEPCSEHSEGYLIPARESIVVPGWRLDNNSVAEFVFKDKRKSYSKQTGHGTGNVGVIGFMVFKEKVSYYNDPGIWQPFELVVGGGFVSGSTAGDPTFGKGRMMSNTISNMASTASESVDVFAATSVSVADTTNSTEDSNETFNIGTGWGDEREHKVTIVDFDRQNPMTPDAFITVYYDSRKGLEARGIKVVGTRRKKAPCLPDPFPGYTRGCKPPPGWKKG